MLVEVSMKRREYPERILHPQIQTIPMESTNTTSSIPKSETTPENIIMIDTKESLDGELKESLMQATQSYVSSREMMHRLKIHIPQLIAKLKDVQQVLLDRRKFDSYESETKLLDD